MRQGNTTFAYANIIFIASSLLLQLALVYIQNDKRGRKAILYEAVIVALAIKPGVDAFRVVHGNKQREDTLLDPLAEATLSKSVEIVAEAVPSSVLQSYALLSGAGMSGNAIASIVVSAASIAYNSCTISMDMDTGKFYSSAI